MSKTGFQFGKRAKDSTIIVPSFIPVNGLVRYSGLDQGAGNLPFDEVTKTEMQGANFTAGHPGVNEFSNYITGAAGSYVQFETSLDLFISKGAMLIFFKTANAGSSFRGLFVRQYHWGMFLNNNTLIMYDWGANAIRNTGINCANNEWRCGILNFDSGVTNGTFLYLDGNLVLTTTITIHPQNYNNDLVVGAGANDGFNQNTKGYFDMPALWNRHLIPAEINNISNQLPTP